MGVLAYLPCVRISSVCLPDSAPTPDDVLRVTLADDLLADLGAQPGHSAIVSLTEEPEHGEAGAIRCGGAVYTGYLFFPPEGGVILGSADMVKIAARFEPGTFALLGRVDRVCASCEARACRPVPRAAEHAFSGEVRRLRWRTDGRGFHVDAEEMRRWLSLFGGDPEDWKGWEWTKFIHHEDREAFVARWRESIETGKPYLNHGRILLGGVWRYIIAEANPRREASGEIIEWQGFMHLEALESRRTAGIGQRALVS